MAQLPKQRQLETQHQGGTSAPGLPFDHSDSAENRDLAIQRRHCRAFGDGKAEDMTLGGSENLKYGSGIFRRIEIRPEYLMRHALKQLTGHREQFIVKFLPMLGRQRVDVECFFADTHDRYSLRFTCENEYLRLKRTDRKARTAMINAPATIG